MRFSALKLGVAATFAATAISSSAHGQFELPAPADDTIVVIGQPSNDDQLLDFIDEVGLVGSGNQYGRWYDPICPAVVGLREEIGAYVEATIRSVAEISSAPLADDDCIANVVLYFTSTPSEAFDQLREARPDLFRSLSASEAERLVRDDIPVSLMSSLSLRGSGGQQAGTHIASNVPGISRRDDPLESMQNRLPRASNAYPGEAAAGGGVYENYEGSRIADATRAEFDFRMLVFDLNTMEGQTIRQLSAYAAMVTLGDFALDRPIVSQQSILNVMHEPSTAPADITDWDLAFLKGLYRLRPARSAQAQRRAIFSASRRALDDLAENEAQ